ncbi:MAG: hypothetical protein AAGN35_14215 [Bacteroidota bacterium]
MIQDTLTVLRREMKEMIHDSLAALRQGRVGYKTPVDPDPDSCGTRFPNVLTFSEYGSPYSGALSPGMDLGVTLEDTCHYPTLPPECSCASKINKIKFADLEGLDLQVKIRVERTNGSSFSTIKVIENGIVAFGPGEELLRGPGMLFEFDFRPRPGQELPTVDPMRVRFGGIVIVTNINGIDNK